MAGQPAARERRGSQQALARLRRQRPQPGQAGVHGAERYLEEAQARGLEPGAARGLVSHASAPGARLASLHQGLRSLSQAGHQINRRAVQHQQVHALAAQGLQGCIQVLGQHLGPEAAAGPLVAAQAQGHLAPHLALEGGAQQAQGPALAAVAACGEQRSLAVQARAQELDHLGIRQGEQPGAAHAGQGQAQLRHKEPGLAESALAHPQTSS